MQAELLLDAQAILGEGPAWDEKNQTLYWVDILGRRVHAWKDGRDDFLQLDEYVGCVAPRREGGLVAALHASFWTLDLVAGKQALLASVTEPVTNRFNDGKCDPAGRLLAGTMDMNEKASSGNLYSLEAGKQPRKLLDGIRISNGLAWSPDHKIFYYIDTPTRQVRAFDYDLDTGNIANPRVVIEVPAEMGWPDGMASDMEGMLWVALWGGAKIARWNPLDGQLEAEVAVPALHTSSCVFGGPRRGILFVTTARVGLDESALAKYPLSGGMFQIQTQTGGMPTFEFAG
ncbi:MAG: SMP-30/gluconolactonase/LRE family protein [Chloroflexota bacterium]